MSLNSKELMYILVASKNSKSCLLCKFMSKC